MTSPSPASRPFFTGPFSSVVSNASRELPVPPFFTHLGFTDSDGRSSFHPFLRLDDLDLESIVSTRSLWFATPSRVQVSSARRKNFIFRSVFAISHVSALPLTLAEGSSKLSSFFPSFFPSSFALFPPSSSTSLLFQLEDVSKRPRKVLQQRVCWTRTSPSSSGLVSSAQSSRRSALRRPPPSVSSPSFLPPRRSRC